MSEWKRVRLGDVCTVERGGSPRPIDAYITDNPDGINWIKIGDTDESMFITRTEQKIIPEGMKKSRYVRPGDFLLSNSMSFGRPYILKIDGCIHDGWLVLRDNNEVFDKRFLYYYLSSKTTYEKFKMMAVGGVVNNLNSEMVRKLDVPIPIMAEQIKIANLLDLLNRIVAQRKAQLSALDELVKARFVEMFGEVENNKYPVVRLGDYAKLQGGYAFKSKDFVDNGVPIVQIGNVNQDYLDWDVINAVPEEYLEKYREFALNEGDLVMAMTRPIIKSLDSIKIAKVSALDLPCLLNQRVGRFKVKDKLHPLFLEVLCKMEDFKDYVEKMSGNSLQPNISSKQVEDYMIVLPPLSLQESFSYFVKKIDKTKSAIQKSLEKTQLLFDSLMQEYFG